VVAVVAVRQHHEEARPVALAGALDGAGRRVVHGEDVLAVDLLGRDPEGLGAAGDRARGRLRPVRVLVVHVVLADVDHRQLPERGHVHHLVEEALAERALAEEAGGDLVGPARLGREGGARRDAGRAADDRVRAEVPVLVVGDVHRAALAAAVAGLLAEQLGEHPVDRGALREAVAVAAVGRGDVVVLPQRLADADRDGLLADVEVGEAGHLRAAVEIVDLLLERADLPHLLVHPECARSVHYETAFRSPAIWASTS